jgi:hypothetical protein
MSASSRSVTCTSAASIPIPALPESGTALVSVTADPAEGVFLECITGGWE